MFSVTIDSSNTTKKKNMILLGLFEEFVRMVFLTVFHNCCERSGGE